MKKKVIFLVIGLLIFAIVGIAGCTSKSAPTTSVSTLAPTTSVSTLAPTTSVSTPVSTSKLDTTTMGERNAAKKALDYLRYTSFSRSGLIEQLEFEGFTHQEAVYGVDQSGADWNEQAALKAEQYLSYTSFSRSGLIEQLEYEGFTRQQAEYGVQVVAATSVSSSASTSKLDTTTMGERNAAKKALDYLSYTSFSRSGLIEQLEYEGFSHQEAVYGVDQSGADWNEQAALKAEQYLSYTSFSRDRLIEQLEYEGFTRQQAEYGVQAVGY